MKKLLKKLKKIKWTKKNIIILSSIILLFLFVIGLIIFMVTRPKNNEENQQSNEEQVQEVVPKNLKIVNPDSKSRPYAVMINNISVARPLQSGLQDAYIIYELIVEGGITRYMALFMDQNTSRIGSIRSSRHYYLDYALENDAIYVHHGQSPQAQSDFGTLGIDRISVDDNTGWRDKTLNVSSEHTLFTSIEKLNKGIKNKRTERNKKLLLNYSVDEIDLSQIEGAVPANDIALKYSNATTSQYKYDAENKYYLRSVNNKEHTDYVTKEQYHFKNIIVYQVENKNLVDAENKGRQELNNIGKGQGYYISDGYAIPIKWSKSSRSEQTKYTLSNGEELKVNDGNTFIQIVPTSGKVTIG